MKKNIIELLTNNINKSHHNKNKALHFQRQKIEYVLYIGLPQFKAKLAWVYGLVL